MGGWHDKVRNTHQSHELRFSTNADYRLRGLVGAYWEKFVIDDNMNFNYLGIPQCSAENLAIALGGGPDCLSAVGPTPGTFATDPSTAHRCQHRLRRGRAARLQADRVLRLGRLRPDPEGADR